jgi:hypothetical protein
LVWLIAQSKCDSALPRNADEFGPVEDAFLCLGSTLEVMCYKQFIIAIKIFSKLD